MPGLTLVSLPFIYAYHYFYRLFIQNRRQNVRQEQDVVIFNTRTMEIELLNMPRANEMNRPNLPRANERDLPYIPRAGVIDLPYIPRNGERDLPYIPRNGEIDLPNISPANEFELQTTNENEVNNTIDEYENYDSIDEDYGDYSVGNDDSINV